MVSTLEEKPLAAYFSKSRVQSCLTFRYHYWHSYCLSLLSYVSISLLAQLLSISIVLRFDIITGTATVYLYCLTFRYHYWHSYCLSLLSYVSISLLAQLLSISIVLRFDVITWHSYCLSLLSYVSMSLLAQLLSVSQNLLLCRSTCHLAVFALPHTASLA